MHINSLFSVSFSLEGRCLLSQQPTPYDAAQTCDNIPFYDALAEHDDDNQANIEHAHNRPSASTLAALASALPNIYSYETCPQQPVAASIEKYVNPLGTVTTLTAGMPTELKTDILDEVVSQLAAEETIIHENCDEALFRPVVAIFCDEEMHKRAIAEEETRNSSDLCKPPEIIGSNLVVPVIAKELDAEMCKREKAKNVAKSKQQLQRDKWQKTQAEEEKLNKKSKEIEEPALLNKDSTKNAAKLTKTANKCAKDKEEKEKDATTKITAVNNKNKVKSLEMEIKTENLKINTLTDSLKELADKAQDCKIPEENIVKNIDLLETVDIYAEKEEIKEPEIKEPEIKERPTTNLDKKTKRKEENKKDEINQIITSKSSDQIKSDKLKEELKPKLEIKAEEIYKISIVETKDVEEKQSEEENNNIIIENSKKYQKNNNTKKDKSSEEITYEVKIIETHEKLLKNQIEETKNTETLKSPTKKQKNVESAWKTLSGADMINKTLKIENNEKTIVQKPMEIKETVNKKSSKKKIENFPTLEPLESLPPLPDLEPLDLITVDIDSPKTSAVSLINFESPLLENAMEENKMTPTPRGFNEKDIIYALCGSLHYENEMNPMTRSNTTLGEQTLDGFTENEEQYISFEHSLLETNNNNNNNGNERFSYSSEASSASEEIIIMEEKKMSKRQKRKLQKNKKDSLPQLIPKELETDEELRPLIDNTGSGMSDSQAESVPEIFSTNCILQTTTTTTTTDSEGPLPATTSDDNSVFVANNLTLHKIKTKKLEHKINLIAAIEAATSSSTSSAEESGIETVGERRASLDLDTTSMVSITSGATSMPLLTLPTTVVTSSSVGAGNINGSLISTPNGGTKKKTKRRKR